MGLKKCEFGTVEGLLSQVQSTHAGVLADKDAWLRTFGLTAQDLMDNAGGRFTEVNAATDQVTAAMQEMQNQALMLGGQSLQANIETVMRSAARYGH
ncbi:hypothetical protein GCM10029976_052320 [Kribbella albertanoniae]|uniref:Uncharacterized protein n=1 Tax=Kribbella albertanoniae TaxID=1266829 RepID=A0A4R4Q5L0_9ACTN|nr:hypothetical protein [Kribbella albertanoniae]TDC30461.1 hypothetical protein E1261_13325 [Kribbella albertanoniae]